jgi:hypothetical protein
VLDAGLLIPQGVGALASRFVVGKLVDWFAAGLPHATMNTRIAQQVGASFGTAIVAIALQPLLDHGATGAFQGAFWWAIGIAIAAVIPAIAVRPASRHATDRPPANAQRARRL